MPLSPGTRIGSYEVLSSLGAGGMGEVYRARDTKLNRDVAVKVLSDLVSGDPDRLARFRREAQVLASLNHPNIGHIYGIEDGANTALILELIEGPTLADRLALGPIPLAEALPIVRQIADAVEAAHDQGIVHRDLKPANIKVRDDGTVKVLDFGLAKALDPVAASGSAVMNSPTLTARATQLGVILGTAAYMAPEQARGKVVDRRADVWAFGVVLYEMLTGRRAFDGDDISVTLANVIKETPSWEPLPADVPESVRRLLRRCLEKDPKRRLNSIGDARLELDETDTATQSEAAVPAAAPSGLRRWERAIWASVAGIATVAAVLFAIQALSDRETTEPVVRFGVVPAGEGRFSGVPPRIAISPDGRSLVFAATPNPGKPEQLWIRRLDSMEVTPVPGTEGTADAAAPQSPFWSPDGQSLAFFVQVNIRGGVAGSRLRTLDLQGGALQTICELPSNNASGTWNADGVMLVSSQGTKGIQRVPAGGGTPMPVTTLDPSRKEIAHRFPQFLPDGRHFIYQSQTPARADWAIFAGSIDSADRRLVVQSEYARFAAPNILYAKGGNLMAQIMDLTSYELSGEPVVVATGLPAPALNGRTTFAVSDNGVLVHGTSSESAGGTADRQLTWFDRSGKPGAVVGPPVSSNVVRLSPDATRVAVLEERSDQTVGRALWVADLGRNVKAPMSAAIRVTSPVWAGSTRLLFGALTASAEYMTMAEQVASGATPLKTVRDEPGKALLPLDVSADGKWIVFSSGTAGSRGLQIFSTVDGKVTTYLAEDADRPHAALSPDGRWLAYVSNESGTHQVWVQPFPDPSRGKWPISANGGLAPRWRSDGRELFYVDADLRLIAVPVPAGPDFVPGRATPLFVLPVSQPPFAGGAYAYDVAPGGQRFLVPLPPGSRAFETNVMPLTVTTNWTTVLTTKRK